MAVASRVAVAFLLPMMLLLLVLVLLLLLVLVLAGCLLGGQLRGAVLHLVDAQRAPEYLCTSRFGVVIVVGQKTTSAPKHAGPLGS